MFTSFRLSATQREDYEREGFLIFRGHADAATVQSLLGSINTLMDRAIAGDIEVGFINQDKRLIARNGGFLSPGKYVEAFGEWNDSHVLPIIEAILEKPVRHSLFGMLAGGDGQPYKQGWHRDLAPAGAPTEQKVLDWFAPRAVQINMALQPADKYLNVVPRSHSRASTQGELDATKEGAAEDAMPGMAVVHLEPGDMIAYNPNLWHRGWNPDGGIRWTLHNAYWATGNPIMAHERGQKETFEDQAFLDRLPPRTRASVERYVADYPDSEPRNMIEVAETAA